MSHNPGKYCQRPGRGEETEWVIADLVVSYTVIFPFINQMISEMGVTDNPERVGYYSGLVVSPHKPW